MKTTNSSKPKKTNKVKVGRKPLKQLPKRILASAAALLKLLYFKPQYMLLAIVTSVVFYLVIIWSLNLGLLQYLLTTEHLSLTDKAWVIISSYSGVFTLPLAPVSTVIFIVSILQGSSIAAIAYSIRKERAINKSVAREFGGTGAAGVLSVLGLGCVPCGTSIITPILTFFFATSTAAIADQVGFYSAILALVVSLITAYLAGYKLSGRLEV